ncbi:hypothetical protein JTB14_013068 [Gonioctena quinquepunctata]|nr:hypothetical protein JTB14_013068 [Gonioctena quinquepunctata]
MASLKEHNACAKQKKNMIGFTGSCKIDKLFKNNSVSDGMRKAEIKIVSVLVEHNVPFLVMDHLSDVIKDTFPDSEIARKFSCKRTKSSAIAYNVLGGQFEEKMLQDLKSGLSTFSVIIDLSYKAIQQNPNFNKFSSQRTHHLNTRNPSADNYTDNYQEYQYSTNDNYTDDYQDSQNFGAESYTDNYQEHQSNISDHTNDQYDFGYSETQLNQYENFQDFPIGPISFDPPINQSIDPTSELQAQVQALNISDNLIPNLNFPNKCSYN